MRKWTDVSQLVECLLAVIGSDISHGVNSNELIFTNAAITYWNEFINYVVGVGSYLIRQLTEEIQRIQKVYTQEFLC